MLATLQITANERRPSGADETAMPKIQAQTWKGSPFTIERNEGKTSGTVILRFHGPFTARDMYGSLTPFALSNMLDLHSLGTMGYLP